MMERVGVDGRGADCLYEASQCSKIAPMLKSPENTGQTMTKKLLMANEAFAHAALEAGVRVVAGYPGTPSSELIETVARLHAEGHAHGVHVEWSTNEKAALELLAGAEGSYSSLPTIPDQFHRRPSKTPGVSPNLQRCPCWILLPPKKASP